MTTAGVKGLENTTSSVGHFNARYPMVLFWIRYPQSYSYRYRPGGRDDVITRNEVHRWCSRQHIRVRITDSFIRRDRRIEGSTLLEALDHTAHSTPRRRHASASTILFAIKKYSLIQLCFPSTSFIIATITLQSQHSASENQNDGLTGSQQVTPCRLLG